MAITYIPVLPTVLIDSRVLSPMAQGATALMMPAQGPLAMHWSEDAATRIYTPLPPPPPDEDRPIPSLVGLEMQQAGVALSELTRLENWMDSRGLRARFYTSAMSYLAQMHRDGGTTEPQSYYIGCGKNDDLNLQDPYVRPRHLSVLPDVKGRYWIRNRLLHTDAYLTRGNADPVPLPHDDRLRLEPGDVITLGDTHLEFRMEGRQARFVRTRPPAVFASDGPTRLDIRIPG